jgi:hypothetical protein
LGFEVDIHGDYLVITAPAQAKGSIPNSGAAYVYAYRGGVWLIQQKLTAGYVADEIFGHSISLQGNRLAVGAPGAVTSNQTNSAVYVYERTNGTWERGPVINLTTSQGYDASNKFGASVALDDDKLLVGIPGGFFAHTGGTLSSNPNGSVAVYTKVPNGLSYSLSKLINNNTLLPTDVALFGVAVAAKNGHYIIGAPAKTVNGVSNAGTVAFGYLP